jgi:uncharacterized membrane protein
MNFYPILSMMHGAAGLLLFLLAIISVVLAVLIAVKPAVDQAHSRLVNKADFVATIEIIVAVVVTLTGVISASMGGWSLSQLWLWLSLVLMAFYIVALIWVTKPARLVVAEGGSQIKSGMQVVLQMGHVLLLFTAFALMELKPA